MLSLFHLHERVLWPKCGFLEQIILLLDGRLRTRANVHMQEYQKTTHATLRMIVLIGSVLCCWGTVLREVLGVERRKGKDEMKVSTLPEGLVFQTYVVVQCYDTVWDFEWRKGKNVPRVKNASCINEQHFSKNGLKILVYGDFHCDDDINFHWGQRDART